MNIKELRPSVIIISIIVIFLILFSIWGTFTYSPDKNREFYIWYIILTICSILAGNFLVAIYKKNDVEKIAENSNKEIGRLADILKIFREYGIENVSLGNERLDWGAMFYGASSIKLAFKSNVKWIENHKINLINFCKNKKNSIQIILPDPHDNVVISQIAKQRRMTQSEVKDDIIEAIGHLNEIFKESKANVEIKITDTVLFSHYYIFSDVAIMTIRSLNERNSPHIMCSRDVSGRGEFFQFCYKQFDDLWNKRSKNLPEQHYEMVSTK